MRRALVSAVAACTLAPAAAAAPLPAAPGCPIFPRTNVWNKPVDRLPVAPSSGTIVESIGADLHLHADFGSGLWNGGPIGIPITVVGRSQRARASPSSTRTSRTAARIQSEERPD